MLASWAPSVTVRVPPALVPENPTVVFAQNLISPKSIESWPLRPLTVPLNAVAASSLSTPVDPVNVTAPELAFGSSNVVPSATTAELDPRTTPGCDQLLQRVPSLALTQSVSAPEPA